MKICYVKLTFIDNRLTEKVLYQQIKNITKIPSLKRTSNGAARSHIPWIYPSFRFLHIYVHITRFNLIKLSFSAKNEKVRSQRSTSFITRCRLTPNS